MLTESIHWVLFVTGAITASMLLQFLAPRPILSSFFGLDVEDEVTLFFARTAALPVALMGVLLVWAGFEPALRTPVMVVVLAGKAAFVASILVDWSTLGRGYGLTVAFDSICVALYAAYLIGAGA